MIELISTQTSSSCGLISKTFINICIGLNVKESKTEAIIKTCRIEIYHN